MATPQLCDLHRFAYGHHQDPPLTNRIAPHATDNTVENRVHETAQAETRAAAPQDPFTFYKTYLDTNVPLLGDQDYFESDDDGYTCHSGAVAAHDASVDEVQPQARGHTATYKLAVRLANRSNGVPLATIIEQGSYSTLNSHRSVGRFPSIKAAENTSPNWGPRRRPRSLDEKVLQDIQEDLAWEHETSAVTMPHVRLNEEHRAADPASDTATTSPPSRFELQRSPSYHPRDDLFDRDDRGVKGFIRGVLQNVRGVSRTRSRSSSITHAPFVEHRESPTSTCKSSPQLDQQGQHLGLAYLPNHSCHIPICASERTAIPPTPGDQTRNRAICSSSTELSAQAYPHLVQSQSDVTQSVTVFGSLPPVLPYRVATRSHERPFSTPVTHAGTRDVARKDGTAQASTSHHDMFDTSARYTFDGAPVYCGYPSSVKEANSARDVFSTQNASFCSTMSTSYSGTVLGVDVDLQHDFSHPIRRSQSPPTPVWFTPQMAELERQASSSESPESVKASVPDQAPCHSITSSALTSLLPLAAASGIVRPNYNTPKISFYSPSGNLIQPESSSPQGTSPSEYGGSPTTTTSYYNKQNANAALSAGSLPVRPHLVPMTTPPTQKTPLPPHLRHHHNYRQPEMSQISSRESSITPKGPVKGCDGVVRENSLTPRSGVIYPHGKNRGHRSAKLTIHDLKAEVKFYKARFVALAAAQSFASSLPKGRTLQKRHVHNYSTYASTPRTEATESRKGGYRGDVFGFLAAHALRVCFCQPYDGAGESTRVTAGACMTGETFAANGKAKADPNAKDAERPSLNARIVGSGRRSEGGGVKRASRSDGAVSSSTRRASYTGPIKRRKE